MKSSVFCTLSCGAKPVLLRVPGASAQSTLEIPEGDSFVLLASGSDLTSISIDDQPVEVKVEKLEQEER